HGHHQDAGRRQRDGHGTRGFQRLEHGVVLLEERAKGRERGAMIVQRFGTKKPIIRRTLSMKG
ncbi:MAG: hypothetical protein KDF67_18065, partial [Ottowia sp.]|nr:hypothetical protein [Ottowia sp.]